MDLDSVYRNIPCILTESKISFVNNLSNTLEGIAKLVVLAVISMIWPVVALTHSVTVGNLVTTCTSIGGCDATSLTT